jgi:DNA-binding NarL/FixJ family response regulator
VNHRSRIVLCDDHPIVLAGLRNVIAGSNDLEIVGEASNGLEAFRLICQQKPDLAIVDVSLPEMNGIVLARRIAKELDPVRILILTLHEDRAYLKQAMEAGARGYLLKRSAAANLVPAIRAVMTGGTYVDPAIANKLLDRGARRARSEPTGGPNLTDREETTLRLVAMGFTTKEIARRLDIGGKSVETFKSRGLDKLGLKSRADLVRFAATHGWLSDLEVSRLAER